MQLEDLKTAAKRLLPAFLSAETSMTVVVCNPSNLEDIVADFQQFGIELNTYQELEDTFLNEDS